MRSSRRPARHRSTGRDRVRPAGEGASRARGSPLRRFVAERAAAAGSGDRGGGRDSCARAHVARPRRAALDEGPVAMARARDRSCAMPKGDEWPDLSDEALAATAEEWLAPHLVGRTRIERHHAGPPQRGLARPSAVEPATAARRGSADPCGSADRFADRGGLWKAEGPVLAVRVQELFGLDKHPSLAGGRVPLILHLLSPAQRPIQITRDLPGFWRGSWAAVSVGYARAISPASLARRPDRGAADPPRKAARELRNRSRR